ncbi:MAG: CoA-acylating methylmalonate-semialdehyde dehydrogenase [Planctomycetota bacterium]|nr:MAG: CoA-acylating methylmalonate-semialdehyde dehydrogenase [Planctomycetota bacterium]
MSQIVPCLIDGAWTEPKTKRFGDVYNPSTGEVIARTPMCSSADVDAAVQAAARAFPGWAETPAVERARIMFRFRELLVAHNEELARLVSREHGKTLAESKGSLLRAMEMVEFAAGLPSLLTGETIENIASNVDCETVRHPLGVVAGITPFNFPAMVPLWMYPVAIVCGNTFVLKPSPRVPLTAVRIGELLVEAGVPKGVFNIVHGDKESVDAILTHPLVRAVSFVGSTPVAKYIYQTGSANGKRVQAAGGAKNHIIIMPDADLDVVTEGLKHSAWGCAGERCMAGSLALPVGDVADEVVERLAAAGAQMRVGRTDEGQSVDMGPLITEQHLTRVRGYLDAAAGGEARLALDGRSVAVSDAPGGYFLGPTIIDQVGAESRFAREEIFGPVLSVSRCKTLEEAIEIGKRCEYGNGAVIFTQSGRAAREFKHRFNAGMIGINVGVPAPMAWFPFTGWNMSFFGDLHIQGKEGMMFYTQQRMTMTRWPESKDPMWKPH